MLKEKGVENEDLQKERWKKQIFGHKKSVLLSYLLSHCIKHVFRLADTIRKLLKSL